MIVAKACFIIVVFIVGIVIGVFVGVTTEDSIGVIVDQWGSTFLGIVNGEEEEVSVATSGENTGAVMEREVWEVEAGTTPSFFSRERSSES